MQNWEGDHGKEEFRKLSRKAVTVADFQQRPRTHMIVAANFTQHCHTRNSLVSLWAPWANWVKHSWLCHIGSWGIYWQNWDGLLYGWGIPGAVQNNVCIQSAVPPWMLNRAGRATQGKLCLSLLKTAGSLSTWLSLAVTGLEVDPAALLPDLPRILRRKTRKSAEKEPSFCYIFSFILLEYKFLSRCV